MADPYRLWRYLDAQALLYDRARLELSRGRKETHWMWFIFPQIEGLGTSQMSQRYAIQSLEEARAYLANPILGGRLRDCTAIVNGIEGRTAKEIFGTPDDLKFRSSMTLFAHATDDNHHYLDAIDKYFGGRFDTVTMAKLDISTTPAPAAEEPDTYEPEDGDEDGDWEDGDWDEGDPAAGPSDDDWPRSE